MSDPQIKYDIKADVTGDAEADKLATALRGVGDVLDGELQQSAQDAAKALEALTAKQRAVEEFARLKAEAREAATALDAATKAVDTLGNELPQASANTRVLAEAERAMAAELEKSQAELASKKQALAQLREETTGAARRTDEYKAAEAGLKAEIAATSAEIKTRKTDLTSTTQGLAQAKAAEADLTKEYQQATTEAAKASAELGGYNRKLDESRAALKAAGIDTGKLAQAKRELKTAVAQAKDGVDAFEKSTAKAGKAIDAADDFLSAAIADWNNTGKAATTAATGVDRANTALSKTKPEADKAKDGIKGVGDGASLSAQAMGQLAAAMAAGFSVQQFVQAAAQMEQLAAGFKAVTGDAKMAGEQMDFVRRMAGAAGVDVVAAGQAFLGLAASTKGTAVEGKMAADVFEAVTVSMAKAGKSSAETQNALLALSQMASKGVVSMEELRGQLGEALPGALQAAASGMGVTTADLIKLVESGKIAAEDIFPALTKGLNELYGTAPAAQTLSQEIANLKNAFTDMASRIGEAGVLDALKVGAESAQTALVFLGESFTVVGQQIGVMAAAVTSLDFSGVPQAMRDIEEASRTNLLRAAEHNTVLRAALKGMGDEAINAALAAKEAGNKAQASGAQAEASAGGWVSMSLAYTNANKAIAETIAASAKEIELIKATGQAAIERARLSGEELLVRQATQQAATQEADAVQKLAELRLREVSGLESELASKRNMLAENGKISETRRKEVEDLEKLIAVKKIEAQTTEAQAAALRLKTQANSDEAIAATAALKATEANRIERAADAQAIISSLTAQKELARQTESIAALMGNETEVRKAKIKQVELEIQITNAKVAAAKAEAEGSIAVANAKLAEMEATKQTDPVKKAELEASIKIAQARLVEAEAVGKNTAVLREQISALNDLQSSYSQQVAAAQEFQVAQNKIATDAAAAKEAEAAAADKAAEATKNAASAAISYEAVINSMRYEVGYAGDAVEVFNQKLMDAWTSAGSFSSFEELGRFLNSAALQAKDAAVEFDGLTDAIARQNAGNTSAAQGVDNLKLRLLEIEGTEQEIAAAKDAREKNNILRMQKVAEMEARRAELAGDTKARDQYLAESAALKEQLVLLEKIDQAELRRDQRAAEAAQKAQKAQKAAQDTAPEAGGARGGTAGTSSTTQATPAPAPQQSAGAAKTYNVTFNGRTVRTASDSDAQALMAMLKDAKASA